MSDTRIEHRDGCGHDDAFKILQGENPEHGARRLEKWKAKRCAPCVAAADEVDRKARDAKKMEKKFRFPDGTVIGGVFNGEKKTWALTIALPDGAKFSVEEPGIHFGLRKLGVIYSKHVKRESK